MNTLEKLDKVDLQILRTLQSNARLTTKELAASVSLSSTPVFERLKRLENGGYIKKYIAVLDAEKLNQGFVVFCSVKLRRLNKERQSSQESYRKFRKSQNATIYREVTTTC